MSGPLLTLRDVEAGYTSGVDILRGLSLEVAEHGLTLIIGPNGAGKSTTLKTIFGFLRAHRGDIAFEGASIIGAKPYEVKGRGIAYVPQEINTFPLLTVEENLRMGGWILRHDQNRLKERLARVYEVFPLLAARKTARAGDLSGGQGRMLSIAREMIAEPKLLLVDEPTAGLAPNLVEQVYDLLDTARRALNATILLVDQNVEDAVARADIVYMLDLGRVKASGPAREFTPERVKALIQECLLG